MAAASWPKSCSGSAWPAHCIRGSGAGRHVPADAKLLAAHGFFVLAGACPRAVISSRPAIGPREVWVARVRFTSGMARYHVSRTSQAPRGHLRGDDDQGSRSRASLSFSAGSCASADFGPAWYTEGLRCSRRCVSLDHSALRTAIPPMPDPQRRSQAAHDQVFLRSSRTDLAGGAFAPLAFEAFLAAGASSSKAPAPVPIA